MSLKALVRFVKNVIEMKIVLIITVVIMERVVVAFLVRRVFRVDAFRVEGGMNRAKRMNNVLVICVVVLILFLERYMVDVGIVMGLLHIHNLANHADLQVLVV
jgi:hypothetical protein